MPPSSSLTPFWSTVIVQTVMLPEAGVSQLTNVVLCAVSADVKVESELANWQIAPESSGYMKPSPSKYAV